VRHLVVTVTSITAKLLDGFLMLLVNLPVVGDSSPTNQQVCFKWDDQGKTYESPWIQQVLCTV